MTMNTILIIYRRMSGLIKRDPPERNKLTEK